MKIFYAISTHWDREWYKPFQEFRFDLVNMTDKLIDALENEKISVFTFDGQTIVLEDYLEIKPNNKERLKNLIKSGKIKIGPWYVMPDELLVSGESIIRNLLTGREIAKEYETDFWKYGYMCDIFGHIAQMPQILNGFGINGAYLGRGVGSKNQNYTNFLWKSPDGSECYAYRETYVDLRRRFLNNEDKEKVFGEFMEKADETESMLFLYTNDHIQIEENTFEFEKEIQKLAEKHAVTEGLEHITEEVCKFKDILPTENGELITTGETPQNFRAVTHSISSYYPIKKQNDMAEHLLENTVSPILAMQKMSGENYTAEFYKLAYRYLLKNQPHDSICGCSCDTVHKDMEYRYSQVHSIADAICNDFLIRNKSTDENNFAVFNFDTKKYSGVFKTDICFEKNWDCKLQDNARYQTYNGFAILDENDNELEYQIIDIKNDYAESRKPYISKTDKYTLLIKGDLKPFGSTLFKIVPKKPKPFVKYLSDGELYAENEYLALTVSPDGSVVVFDKESGKEYKNLNTFIDDGEVGNGWFAEQPLIHNSIVSSKGSACDIELIKNGPLLTSFRVTKYMNVPKSADYNLYARSKEKDVLKIITDITLKQGNKYVEFETTVENNIRDHRLRVEFPTAIKGDTYITSQAFTFIERQRGITEKGAGFAEPEPYEKNTGGIVSVCNENVGLSFISKEGIHECGVSKSGVITATLLRCFGRILHDSIESEQAQLLGSHKYRYAISTETDKVKLSDIKKTMMENYLNTPADKGIESMISIDGNVVVSIIKPSENEKGVIVRLFNPTNTPEDITLNTICKIAKLVTLSEEEISPLNIDNGKISLTIYPHKIETIYLEM